MYAAFHLAYLRLFSIYTEQAGVSQVNRVVLTEVQTSSSREWSGDVDYNPKEPR